jgi:hypothetical protein
MGEDEDLWAIVRTLEKAAEAHAELLKAVQRQEARIKALADRVEMLADRVAALERLRAPRVVPPSSKPPP